MRTHVNQVMRQLELFCKTIETTVGVWERSIITCDQPQAMKHFGSQKKKKKKKGVCALDLKLPLFLPMCGQWMYRQIKGQDGEERGSDFRRERIDRTSGESRMNDRERTWEINGLRINVAPNENEMKWVLRNE